MLKLTLAAVAATCMLTASYHLSSSEAETKSKTAETGKVHEGQEVFEKNCMQCHAVIEGQYSFGPNLYGYGKKPGHKTPAEMRGIIENGKGKMPSMKDKVTTTEVDDVIAYIRTQ